MNRIFIAALAAALLGSAVYVHGDTPPRSGMGIPALLDSVAKAGYDSITEISFDDGEWEVEALKDGTPVELHVDPDSGRILSERSDGPHPRLSADQKSLADIAKALEQAGYGPISTIDFETTGWQAEARRGAQWRELTLDLSGKVVADHPED